MLGVPQRPLAVPRRRSMVVPRQSPLLYLRLRGVANSYQVGEKGQIPSYPNFMILDAAYTMSLLTLHSAHFFSFFLLENCWNFCVTRQLVRWKTDLS